MRDAETPPLLAMLRVSPPATISWSRNRMSTSCSASVRRYPAGRHVIRTSQAQLVKGQLRPWAKKVMGWTPALSFVAEGGTISLSDTGQHQGKCHYRGQDGRYCKEP
jgi:hypothetical protein